MVSLEDLSFENVRLIQGQDYNLVLTPNNVDFLVPVFCYKITEVNGYTLYWKNDERRLTLLDGSDTFGKGWLITNSENIAVKFWSYTGTFSSMPDSLKENVVEAFNTISETQDVETAEGGETGSRPQSLNERGETLAEERERIRQEEAKDEYEGRIRRTSKIIREYDETFSYTSEYETSDATFKTDIEIELIENTREFWSDNTSQYVVDSVTYQVKFRGQITDFETQDAAEAYFDDLISETQQDIIETSEESAQSIYENETESVTDDELDIYFEETDLTFEQMLEPETPREQRAFSGGGYFTGYFGDAVEWTNNGNTIELKDFDTPRITTEGISENLSGGLRFTVAYGWRVKIEVSSNSMSFTTKSKSEVEDIEGIEVDGREFEVTMYGGDILEIDIDNERDGLFPFVITTAGVKWSSIEEIDDEVFITMISAEQLKFKHTVVEKEVYKNPPRQGEIVSENIVKEESGRLTFAENTYLSGLNISGRALQIVNEDREKAETLRFDKGIVLQDVPSESSFIDPDDIVEDVTPDISVSNIFDSLKWWLVGGLVLAVSVGGLYVFINAKARGGE